MSQTASLAAVYTGPHVPDNSWWVRLEQIPVTDDVATVSETANLLDALYQVAPCTDEETTDTDEELTAEDVASAASSTLELAACSVASDGSVEVQIKVIRSHQTEDYRLHVGGGSIVDTVVVHEEIIQNIAVSGANETTLEYPVLGAFFAAWQSDLVTAFGRPPVIKRIGNVLYWEEDATGTLRATFLTVYDLVTIKVDGVDGELGEALVRVVYHGLAEEMTPELPEPAEMDRSLCSGSARLITGTERVTCYKAITVEKLCSCSKDLVDSYSYEQIVDCPDWVTSCPGGAQDCMALLGSETVKEYVECSGDNQVSGTSRVWMVSSADYYRKVCCDDPPNNLPQCYEKITSYRGGQDIVNGRQFWRDLYGPLTRFTPVSPAGGICGKHITRQVVQPGHCCDGVPPLAWDTGISPEVMAPNSAVVIGVSGGGRFPYEWLVSGSGFQFQNGSKRIVTTGNQVMLSALALACGTARITVTDHCSQVIGSVLSTAGQWNDGCYAIFIIQSDVRLSTTILRTPCALASDRCTVEKTGAAFWDYSSVGFSYRSVEHWHLRWSGDTWSVVSGGNWAGDVLASEWDAAISGVEIPVVTSPLGSNAPLGDGSAYSCGGGDGCMWVCR